MKSLPWFGQSTVNGFPSPRQPIIPWAVQNFKIPPTVGNVSSYEENLTPWTCEPLELAASGSVRKETFVKPVQAGGSNIGEILLCYWIRFEQGLIQNNWDKDETAEDRWLKRLLPILEACPPVAKRLNAQRMVNRNKVQKCLVALPNVVLMVQGTFAKGNLDSDSVRLQINEELHKWQPGNLQKAYGRTTRFWDSVTVNISNASIVEDQLHTAFMAGTQQHWEVKCPGCGLYHRMRTRWEDDHPELGGLRYDSESCKRDNGEYDYNAMESSMRLQMPCGYPVRDDQEDRRQLSLSGRYSAPDNTGAKLSDRSHTLEAVSVDYIPFIKLVQEKHAALKALRNGDPEPYRRYVTERECIFWNPEDRPIVHRIVLSDSKKDRAGLTPRIARFGALDRQQGSIAKGEMPHWWGLIQDVAIEKLTASSGLAAQLGVPEGSEVEIIHVLTVWEGKLLTDTDAAATMARHEVKPTCVAVDSGWDSVHVYQFCLEHGYNAIKGDEHEMFSHKDGSRRIFSEERPLYKLCNQQPTRPNPLDEPLYWIYSQSGVMDRLAWLRTSPSVNYEVPSDVSRDFIAHMDSWSFEQHAKGKSKQVKGQWEQRKVRDDLYFCACYIAMLMDMAGIIGSNATIRKD